MRRSLLLVGGLAFGWVAAVRADGEPGRCSQELHFAKGTTSSTVQGTIQGYAFCDYRVAAEKGQELRVSLEGRHAQRAEAVLIEPIERTLHPGEAFELPESGTYTVRVLMPRAFARRGAVVKYTLRLEIR